MKNIVLTIIFLVFAIGLSVKVLAAESNFQQTIYPVTECNDGIDNDGDGGIDFATDPECTSWTDLSESPDAISYPISNPVLPENNTQDNSNNISPTESFTDSLNQTSSNISKEVQGVFQRFMIEPLATVLGKNNIESRDSISSALGFAFFIGIFYLIALVIIALYIIAKRNAEKAGNKH